MAHPLQSRSVRTCCRNPLTCTNENRARPWTPLIRLRDAEVAGSSPAVPTGKGAGQGSSRWPLLRVQARALAPPQPEDGPEVGHRPAAGPEGVGHSREFVGRDDVPVDVRRGRKLHAPTRRPHQQVGLHRGPEDRPEDAVLAPHRPGRQAGGPADDQPLDVGRGDRGDRPGAEGGEQVNADDGLVPGPAAGRLPGLDASQWAASSANGVAPFAGSSQREAGHSISPATARFVPSPCRTQSRQRTVPQLAFLSPPPGTQERQNGAPLGPRQTPRVRGLSSDGGGRLPIVGPPVAASKPSGRCRFGMNHIHIGPPGLAIYLS
jgi:hypothetical protein